MQSLLARVPAWLWPLFVFILMLALGFAAIGRRANRLNTERDFAHEFRAKFIEYANSRGQNRDAYHWLTLNSNRMQRQMGRCGVMANFRDPPFQYTNYPIVVNMLPRIRREFENWNSFSQVGDLLQMFYEALLRYIGGEQEAHDLLDRDLRNPLRWLVAGIQEVTAIPLYILSVFGLMSVAAIIGIQRTFFFKLCSAVVFLLGFAASVIAVVNDGSTALTNIRHVLNF